MHVESFLHNVSELIPAADNAHNHCSRLPQTVRQAINEKAQERCLDAAAVEIRVQVKSTSSGGNVRIFVHGDQAQQIEMYAGDFYLWKFMAGPGLHDIPISPNISYPWTGDLNTMDFLKRIERKRFNPEIIRICFDYNAKIGIDEISGDIQGPSATDVPTQTLLTYGSSITHGAFALSAQNSYAPRLAQLLEMDHLNLGVAGSAFCEDAIAEHIAGREDWDCCTLEMGINMGGFDVPEFEQRVRNMVSSIGGPQQTRPVFCLDMFRHFNDLPDANSAKTDTFRQIVATACAELGGPNTHFISIAQVPSWTGLGADLLHPNERGMEEMAEFLAPKIQAQLAQG